MTSRGLARICVCVLMISLPDFGGGAEETGPASWAGPVPRIGQSAEVEIVSNPKTPAPPPGQRKMLAFTPELSIGENAADENEIFGAAVRCNTDSNGNFYITDWSARRILKFGPDGKYLSDIGARGQGPGEFQQISVARFDGEGNLYLTDLALRRILFFDPAGTYLRQIALPDIHEDLYVVPGGGFVSTRSRPTEDESGMDWTFTYALFDAEFRVVSEFSSIHYARNRPSGDSTSISRSLADAWSLTAFQPSPTYCLGASELIFFGDGKDYVIEVFSLDGRKVRTIKREYRPLPITAKDKDRFVRRKVEPNLNRLFGFSDAQKKEIIDFIEYPEHKPAYQGFCLLENGWLLVTVDVVPGESSLFDLFDETGRYIGQFKSDFPGDAWPFFNNGKAYAVIEGEEFTSVRRYAFEIREY